MDLICEVVSSISGRKQEVPSGPFSFPTGFLRIDGFLFVVCRAERWLLLRCFHIIESDDH